MLSRDPPFLIIEDRLDGRGRVAVDVRFPIAGRARPLQPLERMRLEREHGRYGQLDLGRAVDLDGRAVLAPLRSCPPLTLVVSEALHSPRYGTVERRGLVAFRALLKLPVTTEMALLLTG
jgi:hypothetical protein